MAIRIEALIGRILEKMPEGEERTFLEESQRSYRQFIDRTYYPTLSMDEARESLARVLSTIPTSQRKHKEGPSHDWQRRESVGKYGTDSVYNLFPTGLIIQAKLSRLFMANGINTYQDLAAIEIKGNYFNLEHRPSGTGPVTFTAFKALHDVAVAMVNEQPKNQQ